MNNLKEKIIERKKQSNNQFHISKNKDLLDDILKETSFLEENSEMVERIYCILNDIHEKQKCYCGKDLRFNKKSYKYNKYCCRKCQNNSLDKKTK